MFFFNLQVCDSDYEYDVLDAYTPYRFLPLSMDILCCIYAFVIYYMTRA